MPHYTMRSGVRTVHVTTRCPVCLVITVHDPLTGDAAKIDDITICCCDDHYAIYYTELMKLCTAAQAYSASRYGYDLTQCIEAFLTDIGSINNTLVQRHQ